MSRDIDKIIVGVRERIPKVDISQHYVKDPRKEDDGVWFFKLPGILKRIQIESSFGECPFIVEHDDMKASTDAWQAHSVDEAVEMISSYLTNLKV